VSAGESGGAPGRAPILIGTSSFSSADWVGPFYPEGTKPAAFLSLYAREFATVEVDSTYYAVPAASTVAGWAAKTPAGFVLSAKFPRSIVHGGEEAKPDPAKVLDPEATRADRDRFLEVMAGLGSRLGPLVLQFPFFARDAFPSRAFFLERLDAFLGGLPVTFRYGVEVRNRDWMGPELAEVCRRHRAAMVLVDQAWMPHGDEVMKRMDPVTTDFAYVRLLGDRKKIEAITTHWDKEVIDQAPRLERWVPVLEKFAERGVRTMVYVNNHYAGHAPATARRLQQMLRGASS